MIRITTEEMQDFSRYIGEISGIAIDPGKKYLLENRLQPVLDAQQCNSFYELLFSVKNGENSSLRGRVIDAIATNETYFFRDQTPFDILKHKIVPDIIDRKKRQNLQGKGQVRIWCAACSAGQEVYSVIMAIMETVPDIGNYDIRVLGTDISGKVIARASSGRYSQHEVGRGLPAGLLQKYFVEENGSWRVRDEVRLLASFRHMNLLEPFYGIGPFDIIFCRNVAIYFSEQNKIELFKKIARVLDKDGYLLVGGSESLSEVAPQFSCQRHLKGIFYQRKDTAPGPVPLRRLASGSQPVAEKAELAGSRPASLPARPPAAPVGNGARSTAAAKVERGNKAAGPVAGVAQPRVATGAAPQATSALPRDERGSEDIRCPEGDTGNPVSSLFGNDRKDTAGEPEALLASILNRQRRESISSARERKRQGEGPGTLLESIRDNNEKNAGQDDESAAE